MSSHSPVVELDVRYLDMPGAARAFLVRTGGRPLLVETGTQACLPTLQAALRAEGVAPEDVSDVFVTHIHLDHAGAAGWFACRGARLHVHPFGAAHMVDPGRLIDSSRRVHGSAYERYYGDPVAAPADRVHAVADGTRIECGDVSLRAVETPGHARHHHAWLLEHAGGRDLFTGDAAATVVPGSSFVAVPTPPPEYDPQAWFRSLDRLRAEAADRLRLTHGGTVTPPGPFLDVVERSLREEDAVQRGLLEAGLPPEETLARYRAWLEPRAAAQGVKGDAAVRFVGEAWMKMNLAGVRRSMERPRVH